MLEFQVGSLHSLLPAPQSTVLFPFSSVISQAVPSAELLTQAVPSAELFTVTPHLSSKKLASSESHSARKK